MLNHLAERLAPAGRRDRRARRRRARRRPARRARRRAPRRVPPRAGLPVWRYEVGGCVAREARPPAAPAEHRARHLPAGRGRRRRCGCELRPSVHFRPHDAPVATPLGAPVRADGRRATATSSPPRHDLPPLRLLAARRGRRPSRSTRRAIAGDRLPRRGEPRLRVDGRPVEPRLLPGRPRARATTATLVASTEPWETIARPDAGGGARGRAASGAQPAARQRRTRAPATGPRAELVLAADQFLITPAGRVEDAARGPRRRRRGPHRHRRLPLVHRLGPRHDDQPRRADARHRPARARPATSCAPSPTTSATA